MPRVKKIRSRNINSKTKSKSRKSKSKRSKKIRLRRSSGGTICNINIEVKYYSFNYGDFFLPYIIQEPDPNKYSVDITIKDEIYIRETLYKEHNKEISNRRYNLSIKTKTETETETEKNQYLDLVDEVKDMINKLEPPHFKEIKACKDIDIFFDSLIERGNIMRLLYLIHYVFPKRINYVLKFDKKISGPSYLVVEPVKIFFKYFYNKLTPEKINSIFTF